MSTRTKNPLHPSALGLNDMTVGRRIVQFNREFGVDVEGTVVKAPYVAETMLYGMQLKIDILTVAGRRMQHSLIHLGVIPFDRSNSDSRADWNQSNFTVDARKRHLLPAPVPRPNRPYDYWDREELDYEDEFGLEE